MNHRQLWKIDEMKHCIEIDGMTHKQTAEKLGFPGKHKYIYDLCKKYGIKSQRRGPRSAEGHPDWKGGVTIVGGYRYIYSAGHPLARKQVPYVLEHHLVMEKHLGRYLTRKEVVHHRNDDTLDNRIGNLELFPSNGAHLSKTLKGKCPKWTENGKRRIRERILRDAANPEAVIFGDDLKPQTIDR